MIEVVGHDGTRRSLDSFGNSEALGRFLHGDEGYERMIAQRAEPPELTFFWCPVCRQPREEASPWGTWIRGRFRDICEECVFSEANEKWWKACPHCGQRTFAPPGSGWRGFCINSDHEQLWKDEQRKAKRRVKLRPKRCEGCGKRFTPTKRNDEKYCPETRAACKQRAHRDRRRETRVGQEER